MGKLRRYFIAGLVVWMPLGVTIFLVKFLVDFMDQAVQWLPDALRSEQLFGFRIPGLGVVLLVALVLLTGVIVANLAGRQLLALGERLLARIPLVRAIYSAAKQLTETLFSGTGQSFRKVVLVEYPRAGIWTLAFLTGSGIGEVNQKVGRDLINIFVPTTPNPTSGFFLMVPRETVIELDMSVDAALRTILSAGAVVQVETKPPAGAKTGSAA